MVDLQRSIPLMVDGLKPGQRKILLFALKKPIFQEVKVAHFNGCVEHSPICLHYKVQIKVTLVFFYYCCTFKKRGSIIY
ncbi:putative DNA topoisomerase (ATP-hydrolyzing) [Helianthus anomalus]